MRRRQEKELVWGGEGRDGNFLNLETNLKNTDF